VLGLMKAGLAPVVVPIMRGWAVGKPKEQLANRIVDLIKSKLFIVLMSLAVGAGFVATYAIGASKATDMNASAPSGQLTPVFAATSKPAPLITIAGMKFHTKHGRPYQVFPDGKTCWLQQLPDGRWIQSAGCVECLTQDGIWREVCSHE